MGGMRLRTNAFRIYSLILVACRGVSPPVVSTNVDVDAARRDGGAAKGEYPARETVLLVPVDGGVVEHTLGSAGNPECDDSFTTTLLVGDGLAVAEWKRKQQRFTAMHGRDGTPCEEIGVGDCTLGCKDEGETFHLLVVDGRTGRRLLSIETERRPGEGIKAPEITLDWRAGRVLVRGSGCFESISLR